MAALNAIPVTTLGGVADLAAAAVAAAGGGDTAPVGPGHVLYVSNADASAHTVTLATPGTVDGHAIADATLVVAAGKSGLIPLTTLFRGATGRASLTYDGVTALKVAVLKIGA
ncbi:hypothetical protein [Streptomyces showdoensis]|uniref:Uncharacterized protein n=1 Tax=Streptomyces showdoensis TaxID=68268 RepID=A0A2P2GL93_STREW|nr:hypothetical protein [Streptomyces showdoensis]KKZ72280.1 hypothetical protein VO63_19035 [Streptomyces showdoensis]